MQSEVLEKPSKAKRTVKPFTIRKAIVPGRTRQGVDAQADMNSSGYGTAGGMQADGSYTDLNEQARAQIQQ